VVSVAETKNTDLGFLLLYILINFKFILIYEINSIWPNFKKDKELGVRLYIGN
jgi:hypothetical protein